MDQVTVPVLVDSIRREQDFQRTRCIYYRVERDVESPVLPGLGPVGEPQYRQDALVYLSDMSILTGPVGDAPRFTDAESIQTCFDTLERDEHTLIATAHIWVPNAAFECLEHGACRQGSVLRMQLPFFMACLRWSRAEGDLEFPEASEEMSTVVEASPPETQAFRKWRQNVVEESKKIYRSEAYAAFRLPKRKRRPGSSDAKGGE